MDDGIKQRVVGAVVLTAVAVLFLPALFERESRRKVDTTTQIPPAPVIEAVDIQQPVRPEGIVAAKDPVEMFQPDESMPVDETPVTEKLSEKGIPRAWVIQVASFKSEQRAEALLQRLQSKGYTAYSRKASTSKGDAFRVFVGPKVDKTRVWEIKKELDKMLNTKTLVLKFKP